MKLKITKLINNLIQEYRQQPVDLLNLKDSRGEFNYIIKLQDLYLKIIKDINNLFHHKKPYAINILDIGTFLGFISLALAKLNYQVTAADILEFINCKNLQKKFKLNKINYKAVNLNRYHLPFKNNQFHLVVLTEVLEHLNFNPLPIVKEINRVLKNNGYLYLTTPNLGRLNNRLSLLQGKSIHNSISDYYAQLSTKGNMLVGIHWREYTKKDLEAIFNRRLGFKIVRHEYFTPKTKPSSTLKYLLFKLLNKSQFLATLKTNHVLIVQKINSSKIKFYFTEANRPQ